MPRADILLVDKNLARSRTQARSWIEQGRVAYFDGVAWQTVPKPGFRLHDDAELRVAPDSGDRYVSRGGLKLAAALERAGLDVGGMTAIDIGASTGGFTDCLLQAGAARVVCVDVGHGQLTPSIRDDARVINYEGVNARDLPAGLLRHAEGGFDLAVMDVSFISQTKILPSLVPLIRAGGWLITLVKPQFEVGREGIGKGGIVRDERLYTNVRATISDCCAGLGVEVVDYLPSPIAGGDGNREFLLLGKRVRVSGFRKSANPPPDKLES